ncbi:MAG: aldo/keto reductase, partial [Deltaproteobacteria bacterium]|nr:aldo/keto reductase [Deltaproteobacteria bacterium]
FVWSPDQVEEILGRPDTEAFCAYYDVTPEGNWEGVSILRTPRALGAVAAELGTTEDALATTLAAARRRLYAARLGRVPPLTDDKVLASWNGLMISAMAEGARVFGDARYRESAERAAEFVLGVLSRPDGGLYRTARGARAHLPGYLEDYAFVADALVDLYESGGSERYLKEALRLAERLVADFGDPEGGAFHQTAHQHEALIARLREGHDGALPNANAVAARALARLGAHFDRKELRDRAAAALLAHGQALQRAPRAFVTSLGVLDFLLEGPVELALVGPRDSAETRALAAAVARRYLPNRIVAHLADGDRTELPLLAAKSARGGPPALHVCRGFTCQAPVTDPRAVDAALHEATTALSRARSRVLGRTALPGRATPEATRQRCEELARSAGEHATIALGSTGLTVSRLGFGCYRVDARAEPHREALTHALTRGVNLIDTSTNYADGWSERLVGEVLRDLHQQGTLRRESVVVVSKVGYAQGENLALARERGALGRPFPEMVEYGEELWHCIHPEWIEDQLGRSLERLRLETLDVLLLHNPEYFLGHAAAKGEDPEAAHREFYRRVTEAFRHLEAEVKRGRIGCYGVSSNTLGEADGPETTRLARLLDAAREAGGAAHHFRVVQLPLNLLEAGGALRPGTGEGADETLLTAASRHGLAVLANRPLNAILERGLLRLADPPELPGGASFPEALAALRELEREFGKSFAPSLTVPEGSQVRADQLLRWADQLGALGADLQSYEQWRDIETRAVAPRLLHVLTALDRAFTGREAPRWVAFRERYAGAMDDLLRSLRRRGADRSRRRSRALALALDPALAAERRAEPLSRKALFALTSEPGVTAVLVGMREVRYVDDALPVLGWAPTDAVSRLLEAASRAELG